MDTPDKTKESIKLSSLPATSWAVLFTFLEKEDLLILNIFLRDEHLKDGTWKALGIELFGLRVTQPFYMEADINDTEYIEYKLYQELNRSKHTQDEGWRGCIYLYSRLKTVWSEFGESTNIQFPYCMVDRVITSLKDPGPPSLTLRRTSQVDRTDSEFQCFLAEVIYEDSNVEPQGFALPSFVGGDYLEDTELEDLLEQEISKLTEEGDIPDEEEMLLRRYYSPISPEDFLLDINPDIQFQDSLRKTFGFEASFSRTGSLPKADSEFEYPPPIMGLSLANRGISTGNLIDSSFETPKLNSKFSVNISSGGFLERNMFEHSSHQPSVDKRPAKKESFDNLDQHDKSLPLLGILEDGHEDDNIHSRSSNNSIGVGDKAVPQLERIERTYTQPFEALPFPKLPSLQKSTSVGVNLSNVGKSCSSGYIEPKIQTKPTILQFTSIMEVSALLYCRIVVLMIKGQAKKTSRLTGFTHLWSKYARGTIQLNNELVNIFDTMNGVFGNLFADYPQFPKYSLWRLFVKIWIKDVIKATKSELNNIFLELLLNHRLALMLDPQQGSNTILDRMPESFFKLTKLQTPRLLEDFKSFFDKLKVNHLHVLQLLQNYTGAIVDISFNEYSVHSASHSRVKMGSVYKLLEHGLYKQTKKIYESLHPIKQGKDDFRRYFSEDCRVISLVFLGRTYAIYFRQAIHNITSILHNDAIEIMDGSCEEIKLEKSHLNLSLGIGNRSESCSLSLYKNTEDEFKLGDLLKFDQKELELNSDDDGSGSDRHEYLMKTNSYNESVPQNRARNNSFLISHKTQKKDLVEYSGSIENNKKTELYTTLKTHYWKLGEGVRIKFEKRDQEIDAFNKSRNIPRELEDAEVFYSLTEFVDIDYVKTIARMNTERTAEIAEEDPNHSASDGSLFSNEEYESELDTMIESERLKSEVNDFSIPWIECMNLPEEPKLVST